MSALESSIALIEAEKRDLYGRMKALDDALLALRRIRADTADEGAVPRDCAEPKRGPASGSPASAHRSRRKFSNEDKAAGVELARRLGIRAAAKQLDVVESLLRNWVKNAELYGAPAGDSPRDISRAPETEPAGPDLQVVADVRDPSRAPEIKSATSQLLERLGKRACSCGETFETEEEWKAHNDSLRPSQLRQHRLQVASA